jgi:Fur family transcriptional regulator, ferric uptake regulator
VTIAPDVPRLEVTSPDEAIDALRTSGLRLSTARRLLIEALFAADGPVSAPALARTLALDESSVYRNLEVLERHGLIRHVHLGHGPGLYALVGRDDGEYLYCERCGRVTVLDPDQLAPVREHIKDNFGHTARFTHFAIVGLCAPRAAKA